MNLLLPFLLAVSVPQQETDTSLLQYEVNGVRVIHQRRPATSDVIAVQLYLLGGSRNVNAEQAGVEQLLLEASAFGSERYPGEASRRAVARTGSLLTANSTYDFSLLEFDGLKQDFDSTWAVFSDRLMRPALDSASIEVVRQRMIGRVSRRRVSPEDYAWVLADSLAFEGHPYANHPGGSERSLKGLTPAAVRQYHKENLIASRLVLVVTGDLTRARVEGAVTATLGTLPRGEYKWQLPPPVAPTRRNIAVAPRSVRTNYIVGTLFGPARGSPEYAAFDQAMSLFGSYVGYYVREAAQLSYAAGITTVGNGVPHARLFVSTTDPDSVMRIVENMRVYLTGNVTIPRARIREQADNFTRAYLSASETASGQAYMLANAFLYEGDARMASRSAEIAKRLTFFDMRRSLINHTKCFQWAFVGDTTSAPRELMLGKDPTCK